MTKSFLAALAAAIGPLAGLIGAAPALDVHPVIVSYEPGRFEGWPANHGIWSWGNEILVGYSEGYYQNKDKAHSLNRRKQEEPMLARSVDGGLTWRAEPAPQFEADKGAPCPGGIDFTSPGFGMRIRHEIFFVTRDRGHHWSGPYVLPDFGLGRLTSRTDYLVNEPRDCTVFLSCVDAAVHTRKANQDRAFAARTTDGGKSFHFLGWIAGEPRSVRAAMPATVRTPNGGFVSLLRRQLAIDSPYRNEVDFLDAFGSHDGGVTWKFLSRVAYTDNVMQNGNPPSAVTLKDGRIAAVYGVRTAPFGIHARISSDGGASWGPELVLRDDGRKWDLGYCRSVVRPDGKVVSVYYYTTAARPEEHIEATIWAPPVTTRSMGLSPNS